MSTNQWPTLAREVEAAAGGAVAGAGLGMIAGPPGLVAGVILGGVAGAATAAAAHAGTVEREAHTARLAKDMGVTGDELGAPNLRHPPPIVGAYSAAAAGVVAEEFPPAEGPLLRPPDS